MTLRDTFSVKTAAVVVHPRGNDTQRMRLLPTAIGYVYTMFNQVSVQRECPLGYDK